MRFALARSIAHQPSRLGILAPAKHGGHSLRDGESREPGAVRHRRTIGENDHCVRLRPSHRLERPVELGAFAERRLRKGNIDEVDAESLCGNLGRLQLGLLAGMVGI